jgi:hypothetical protein
MPEVRDRVIKIEPCPKRNHVLALAQQQNIFAQFPMYVWWVIIPSLTQVASNLTAAHIIYCWSLCEHIIVLWRMLHFFPSFEIINLTSDVWLYGTWNYTLLFSEGTVFRS